MGRGDTTNVDSLPLRSSSTRCDHCRLHNRARLSAVNTGFSAVCFALVYAFFVCNFVLFLKYGDSLLRLSYVKSNAVRNIFNCIHTNYYCVYALCLVQLVFFWR